MRGTHQAILAAALVLAAQCAVDLAQSAAPPPAGEELRTAQLSWRSDPERSCPELRQTSAGPGAVAVVQFMVGATGVPAQASVRSSSGSAGFDSAAVRCVLKLHFQPATRFGDGVAVESWQQLSLKSEASPVAAGAAVAGAAAAAPVVAAPAASSASCDSGPAVKSDAHEAGGARVDQPGPVPMGAGVCVCVDESGRPVRAPVLMNSSGISGVDKAALDLSSAARYHPAISGSGQPAAGCFHFKVGIELR